MSIYLIPIHLYILVTLSIRGSRKRSTYAVTTDMMKEQLLYYEKLRNAVPTDTWLGKITIALLNKSMRIIEKELDFYIATHCVLIFIPIKEIDDDTTASRHSDGA